jgi:hypothetical protein
MNRLFSILLFPFAIVLSLAQTPHPPVSPKHTNQPEALVRSLYQQVLVRTPSGLLYGSNRRIFSPYLSKSLLGKLDVADECVRDWERQNKGRLLKPPFNFMESGIFTGGDEKTSPGDFHIERVQAQRDGSLSVFVRLTYRPRDGPGSWRVATVVTPENGTFVVNDVIYLKDKNLSPLEPTEYRLSDVLTQGCEGSHWVGYRGH